jgi:hypothetical protein
MLHNTSGTVKNRRYIIVQFTGHCETGCNFQSAPHYVKYSRRKGEGTSLYRPIFTRNGRIFGMLCNTLDAERKVIWTSFYRQLCSRLYVFNCTCPTVGTERKEREHCCAGKGAADLKFSDDTIVHCALVQASLQQNGISVCSCI